MSLFFSFDWPLLKGTIISSVCETGDIDIYPIQIQYTPQGNFHFT